MAEFGENLVFLFNIFLSKLEVKFHRIRRNRKTDSVFFSSITPINKGLFIALGDQSYVTSCGVWFWVKPIANTVVSIIFRICFCHAEIAHKRALD